MDTVVELAWYARRLHGMSPGEVAGRLRDRVVQTALRVSRDRIGPRPDELTGEAPPFPAPAGEVVAGVDASAQEALFTAADALLSGRWTVFGSERADMAPAPDWFLDPRTGDVASAEPFSASIDVRQPSGGGDLRYLWEVSRHQHVTLLAAAWASSGDERYALGVERQLRSWWSQNPFLRGPHWTSCMELGLRLIAWVWCRRLLSGWCGVRELFDDNPRFRTQLYHHQYLLDRFPARGSSANNHRLAEAVGQFVACCALPYFRRSPRWRDAAVRALRRELRVQTFASGLHRELASDYHVLVLELALVAGLEGEATGYPLGDDYWWTTCSMLDALAASVDTTLRPPRQGDGDDATALRLDAPGANPVASLLHSGERLFGALAWWPRRSGADVRTPLWAGMAARLPAPPDRPPQRPDHFPDAGMTILRDAAGERPEVWCRCDGGPHGYGSIAAHAHADALAVEVRCDGVDVLAEPGTYTYHAEPDWRDYFRSTLAHNTLELAGRDQSLSGGPFLWTRHAQTAIESVDLDDGVCRWTASHDGYESLPQRARHRRLVQFDRSDRVLRIEDRVTCRSPLPARLAFHLGSRIRCELSGSLATLHWEDEGVSRRAALRLPADLAWEAVRGRTQPPLGWSSPRFGVRVPAWCLLGEGAVGDGAVLVSEIRFEPLESASC